MKCEDCGKDIIGMAWHKPTEGITICHDCMERRMDKCRQRGTQEEILYWRGYTIKKDGDKA